MNEIMGEDTFKIRLALAGILLILVILFDVSGKSFAGIPVETLYRAMKTDYFAIIDGITKFP